MAVFCGAPDDDGISEHLKCRITQSINGAEVTVTAYVTDEAQVTYEAMWETPFAGDSIGEVMQKAGGLAQVATDRTSQSLLNSQKIWEGASPPEVSFTLKFIAYTDAKKEVNDPIMYLVQMMSADINEYIPGGRIPDLASFKFGKTLPNSMIISSISYDANAPKTKEGYFAYNTVTISATPEKSINKSEIPNHFQ